MNDQQALGNWWLLHNIFGMTHVTGFLFPGVNGEDMWEKEG